MEKYGVIKSGVTPTGKSKSGKAKGKGKKLDAHITKSAAKVVEKKLTKKAK